jgi:hypothetical protein
MPEGSEDVMPKDEGLKNLKPFQPGQSGNPAGRPKGSKHVSTIILEMLRKAFPDEDIPTLSTEDSKAIRAFFGRRKIQINDAIAARMVLEALKGESWAMKELLDRTEGKVTEKHEHSNPDGTGLGEPIANAMASFEKSLLKIYGDEPDDK